MLAADGLSTPRAGIADPENGVGYELFIEFDASNITSHQIDDWTRLLISLGNLVANGYQVPPILKNIAQSCFDPYGRI